LKLLTYEPTGGIVAAPTTSLPELIGGVRNWDYRFCWLRDATLALYALMTGYRNEARAWREWLLRSAAGHPSELQIMGFDRERNTFIQHYGGSDLDASLLLIPQLGFLPSDDPRVISTIEAIERDLVVDGLVMRYPTRTGTDGLPGGEGAFLVCSFWLANSLAWIGRQEDAVALFERLLTLRNDLGLLAEEYDPRAKRFLGNFPQAFSHIGVVNTAANLARVEGASADRGADKTPDPKPGASQGPSAMQIAE
jgi:GH15 family glucan-1,4-alpha-glucosidase